MDTLYSDQIKRLRDNPERLDGEWFSGVGIFASSIYSDHCYPSCLTVVKSHIGNRGYKNAEGIPIESLVEEIKQDSRIPKHIDNVNFDDLEVFAEYQERIEAGK